METLFQKALRQEPLTEQEALTLYRDAPVNLLAAVANAVRKQIKGNDNIVTWQIDRNVNITNVCVSGCKFCNFHCKPTQPEKAFVTSLEEYSTKIVETLAKGGDQLLLQGGLHPKWGIEYYETLFRELKHKHPNIKLHALGPPEVVHLSKKSKLEVGEVLKRLVAAGLDSLPGAGAEILDTEFRKELSPGKCSAEEWLEVMRIAHKMNLPTSATMVYGIHETDEMIIRHLLKLRDLQSEKPDHSRGFIAFIPWIFSTKGTELEHRGIISEFSAEKYIRIIAISRILLYNIENIQASWLTVGSLAAQTALHAGANDLGSIMIEENVVAATGLHNKMDAKGIQECIREAGFIPQLRDQQYRKREYNFAGQE